MKASYLIPFMLLSGPAMAQQAPIEKIYACVDVAEASVRHACFDALIPELKRARTGSIIIPTTPPVRLQQQQTAELGAPQPPPSPLTAPVGAINRAATAPAPSPDRITLAVKTIATGADGKARFTMDNGQVWRQVDTTRLRNLGSGPWTAEIRKAALGSYLLTLNKSSAAVRVERVN
jgi:hypothetical protein